MVFAQYFDKFCTRIFFILAKKSFGFSNRFKEHALQSANFIKEIMYKNGVRMWGSTRTNVINHCHKSAKINVRKIEFIRFAAYFIHIAEPSRRLAVQFIHTAEQFICNQYWKYTIRGHVEYDCYEYDGLYRYF